MSTRLLVSAWPRRGASHHAVQHRRRSPRPPRSPPAATPTSAGRRLEYLAHAHARNSPAAAMSGARRLDRRTLEPAQRPSHLSSRRWRRERPPRRNVRGRVGDATRHRPAATACSGGVDRWSRAPPDAGGGGEWCRRADAATTPTIGRRRRRRASGRRFRGGAAKRSRHTRGPTRSARRPCSTTRSEHDDAAVRAQRAAAARAVDGSRAPRRAPLARCAAHLQTRCDRASTEAAGDAPVLARARSGAAPAARIPAQARSNRDRTRTSRERRRRTTMRRARPARRRHDDLTSLRSKAPRRIGRRRRPSARTAGSEQGARHGSARNAPGRCASTPGVARRRAERRALSRGDAAPQRAARADLNIGHRHRRAERGSARAARDLNLTLTSLRIPACGCRSC